SLGVPLLEYVVHILSFVHVLVSSTSWFSSTFSVSVALLSFRLSVSLLYIISFESILEYSAISFSLFRYLIILYYPRQSLSPFFVSYRHRLSLAPCQFRLN